TEPNNPDATAHLALLEDLANHVLRRERVFKLSADVFAERTEWLLSKYRFPREILLDLCRDLGPILERETRRTKAIPVHTQLLYTRVLLATGTFQREVGDICAISQPSLSRIMPTVLDAINSLVPAYIQFPYSHHQHAEVKRGFHAIAGFPNIIGAIDWLHSINVELISNVVEQDYNLAHARSRAMVEHAIGLLKGRWLCLPVCPPLSAGVHIVIACRVLHNLAIRKSVPLQEPPRPDDLIPHAEPVPPPNAAAIQIGERIVQRF
uniref:DDE Tnp4 domain-containing protein n=1 Tax=Stegastes partitus TaxID=144197 RepID=A0A3B4Z0H8_9TELE